MILIESCYDCGGDGLCVSVPGWFVYCDNCDSCALLPREALTKDEIIKIWNDKQTEKAKAKD